MEEYGTQVGEMQDCLATGNFDSLAKVAHTLKGSLGTLHAHRARTRAQALEIAATRRLDWRMALENMAAAAQEAIVVALQPIEIDAGMEEGRW